MKPQTLLVVFTSLLLSGCCTKKFCSEESYVHISFHGFEPSDIDTIYCTGYEIGSALGKVGSPEERDTTWKLGHAEPKMVLVRDFKPYPSGGQKILSDGLPDTYEWKVYIPAVNRTLIINKYGYMTFKCNSCFPVSPRENKKRSLSTCEVNGVESNVNDVRVDK